MYQQCVTAVAFAVCAYTDIRCRKVYKKVAVVYFLMAAAGRCAKEGMNLPGLIAGLIPGAVCFLISWATHQGLGYGDSMLLLVCGVSLGLRECTGLMVISFFLAGIWAAVLLCGNRASRKSTFPFVPFLLLGLLVQNFCLLL